MPSKELVRKYGGKVGALVYTSPVCVRVEATYGYAISRLSRALTFQTEELEAVWARYRPPRWA